MITTTMTTLASPTDTATTAAAAILPLIVVLLLLVGTIAIGYRLAQHRLRDERQQLLASRKRLQAEWTALDNTRRVRAVFLAARHGMAEEARRQEQWQTGRRANGGQQR